MKMFLLKNPHGSGYDYYDSIVVVAEIPEVAVGVQPNGEDFFSTEDEYDNRPYPSSSWCSPDDVEWEEIGVCHTTDGLEPVEDEEGTVIAYLVLASFNAG